MKLKELARLFLDGVLAGIIFNLAGNFVLVYLPSLPFGISSAFVIGILVLIIDFILREVVRL